jgi:acyl-CoA reductase-like NAD-dependent aldehyde dehydrogenase
MMASINGASYVGGEFLPSTETFSVINPATEQAICDVTDAGRDDFEAAVVSARRAFDEGPWPRMTPEDRIAQLAVLTECLERRTKDLVEANVAETGSPRRLSEAAQVGGAFAQARQLSEVYRNLPEWEHNELPLSQFTYAPGKLRMSIRRFEPVGVVSSITPYNFPFLTNIVKVYSALLVGNTTVLRPSPLTPLEALVFSDAAAEADLPPGVLNIVAESSNAGAELMTTHKAVDFVNFTGSCAVGRLIAAQAAPTIKGLVLELGGKSVQLHLLDSFTSGHGGAVAGALRVFLGHSGQACVAQTRMLVPRTHLDETIDAIATACAAITVGDPQDPATQMGPVISRAQQARCRDFVQASVVAGGVVAAGGNVPAGLDKGWFFEPTLISIDRNDNPAAQEEIFGPVVTIQPYDSVEEAIAISNDTDYGLSAGVYTTDLSEGMRIAERMRTGAVQINTGAASGYTPAGGVKQSGVGRERGAAGLRALQELKHIVIGSV